MNKVQFVANAKRWFDKVNGNTYHSVRITRTSDGATIACQWQYGYGDQYRYTALEAMTKAGWIGGKYAERSNGAPNYYAFERENNYPIQWNCSDGLKRDMVKNGVAGTGEVQFMTTTTHSGLIRVCSYCRRMIGDDDRSFGSRLLAWCHEMAEGDHITHGACLSCVAIERKKLAQYKKDRLTVK